MLLKNIFGILIILLNAAGIAYLGFLAIKRALNAMNEKPGGAIAGKKESKQTQNNKEEAFNESDFQKDDDLIDDFDLTDFDDLDLDDLD